MSNQEYGELKITIPLKKMSSEKLCYIIANKLNINTKECVNLADYLSDWLQRSDET